MSLLGWDDNLKCLWEASAQPILWGCQSGIAFTYHNLGEKKVGIAAKVRRVRGSTRKWHFKHWRVAVALVCRLKPLALVVPGLWPMGRWRDMKITWCAGRPPPSSMCQASSISSCASLTLLDGPSGSRWLQMVCKNLCALLTMTVCHVIFSLWCLRRQRKGRWLEL